MAVNIIVQNEQVIVENKIVLQKKTTNENGDVVPDYGYDGLSKVTVDVRPNLQDLTIRSDGKYTAGSGYDGLGTVTVDTGDIIFQEKSIEENGAYMPDEGYDGFSKINVNVIPKLQEKTITENGEVTPDEGYDGLSKVTVNIETGSDSGGDTGENSGGDSGNEPALQEKTIYTNGEYLPDEGYDGFSKVTVLAEGADGELPIAEEASF